MKKPQLVLFANTPHRHLFGSTLGAIPWATNAPDVIILSYFAGLQLATQNVLEFAVRIAANIIFVSPIITNAPLTRGFYGVIRERRVRGRVAVVNRRIREDIRPTLV
jgi:hypothetical protein